MKGKNKPDEIEIRWRVFQATLFYQRTAPEPHKKFLVEYKRKTGRRPPWSEAWQREKDQYLQGRRSVA